MTNDAIKSLSEQLDAAQLTLQSLRLKSGCETYPLGRKDPARRHENAYQAAIRSLNNRRARSRHFDTSDLFGEPAWDILLDLYVHQFKNHDVSVKAASIGSGAPASTALRWLKILEKRGLIFSDLDPSDHRRRFVRLTPSGYESMTRYLDDIAR